MAEDKVTSGSSNKQLHEWALALLDDGEARKNAHEGIWWQNIATYLGDLWVEWDPHRRRLNEPVKKARHKVRIPVNMAQPIVRTEKAKLTKNRPITDCVPDGDEYDEINAAKVGDKMLNSYAEREFHLAKVRSKMLDWVTICGSGGIFVDFNDKAEELIEVYEVNGEPIFDERVIKGYQQQMKKSKGTRQKLKKVKIPKGEFEIKAISPMQLIWDFSALEPEDAWWQIITDVMDCDIVEHRWGTRPDAESDAEPGLIERRLLQQMDLTQSLTPPSPKAQDLCRVYRLFVKPGHPRFPKGAEIVFTKNELLKAKDWPYQKMKTLPGSMMGHIPLPTSQYDMSTIQQTRPLVLELSKTESQMLENRNMTANPPWLIPLQSRLEGPIPNKPGLKISYNHVPNVPPPQPVQMPDLPAYVKELPGLLREQIQDISGQGETSQGRVPPGARSGVAIAYLQEEDDTKLGPTVVSFEEIMEHVNWQILQIMAEKYDVPRTVKIYRPNSEPEVFDFVGTMLNGVAGVQVQAGSALPRSKAAKQQFILDLWDRRLEQDPRKVRQMLELSQGEPDEWEKDMAQAERENRRLQSGEDVPVEEWHNHPAHLYKHRQFMKTAEFERYDDEKRSAFLRHCQEHEGFEQQQRQQQIMLQGAQGEETGGGAPAANGMNVPGGAPPEFSGESPRSLMGDGPA